MWVGKYLAPWLGRRALGRSSGDGRLAKLPQLTQIVSDPNPLPS